MTVRSVETSDKMEMYVAFKSPQYDSTLTEIGEDYGVSRKTVRRCVDEVDTFLSGLSEGDTVKVADDRTAEIISIEYPIEDDMPIKVQYQDDGEVEWLSMSSLLLETVDTSESVVDMEAESGKLYAKINEETVLYSFARGMNFDTVFPLEYHSDSDTYSVDGDYLLEAGGEHFSEGYPYHFFAEWLDFTEEVETENAEYFVTAPQDSITIVRIDGETGDVDQRQTNKHRVDFQELRNRIREDQSQETLRTIYAELDTKHMLQSYSVGRVKVDPEQESVVFVRPDGSERPVPDDLSADIVETVKRHGRDDSEKLVKFLDKLMDNVSFKAIEGLYRFMKHNCIGINDDGSIQAWKGVRNDLFDKYSGKIYNGDFGSEIRVDRSEVDDDPEATCSHGLHVGNKDYASMWAPTLLEVRVEPQDVVAVPKDYNGAKMRTCAYTPLAVHS